MVVRALRRIYVVDIRAPKCVFMTQAQGKVVQATIVGHPRKLGLCIRLVERSMAGSRPSLYIFVIARQLYIEKINRHGRFNVNYDLFKSNYSSSSLHTCEVEAALSLPAS